MSLHLPDNSELLTIDSHAPHSQSPEHHVVICAEEDGGTKALLPVVHELLQKRVSITALVGGVALGILAQQDSLQLAPTQTPPDSPDALLFGVSNDGRLELDLRVRYPEIPSFMIEDYYVASRYALERIARAGLTLPTIFTLDNTADVLLRERFPDLDIRTEQTGSPALDALRRENAPDTKKGLDVEDKKLVAIVLPCLGHAGLAREIAQACAELNDESVAFAVLPHPNDTVSASDLSDACTGIYPIDTKGYGNEAVYTAADLVISQRSTAGLKAATLQIPNISLGDYVPYGFTRPLVSTGASVPAMARNLTEVARDLLTGTSARAQTHRDAIKQYESDGKAASRIVQRISDETQLQRAS